MICPVCLSQLREQNKGTFNDIHPRTKDVECTKCAWRGVAPADDDLVPGRSGDRRNGRGRRGVGPFRIVHDQLD